ncbi:MAG: tetratricopeptide repeat protein [Rufibacter sp.]
MNKILPFLLLLSFLSFTSFVQDKITDELKALSEKEQFEKITKEHAPKAKGYPAKALYYIGLAYYMQEDDNNCLKFLSQSIALDPKDAKAHHMMGSTLNYMKRHTEAAESFKAAIALKPDDGEYHSGLGDAYYNLGKLEEALAAYQKATTQPNAPERSFSMVAQVLSEQKQDEKALEAFYLAKSKVSKESDAYQNVLYNIGLLESLKGNYGKAEGTFLELLQLAPKDYQAHAKLIQCYYQQKQYDKAKPYRENLYQAHKNKELKDNLEDMFCFDQFKWNDKLIQVFERYEEGSKSIYYKHLFYVVNTAGEIEYRLQTEYSLISVEMGGPAYLLGMNKGNSHYTFGFGFKKDFNYDDLKKSVVTVLEGKAKPASSSRPSN